MKVYVRMNSHLCPSAKDIPQIMWHDENQEEILPLSAEEKEEYEKQTELVSKDLESFVPTFELIDETLNTNSGETEVVPVENCLFVAEDSGDHGTNGRPKRSNRYPVYLDGFAMC